MESKEYASGAVSIEALRILRDRWRRDGQRLVITNGVFDVLHSGHVAYLQQARALGDLLVVGLNSDASTRAIKGSLRPLVGEAERAEVLAALRCVDYVVIFHERTAEKLVQALQPDVYAKGGDYAAHPGAGAVDQQRLPEARVVYAYGGRVVLIPYRAGRSTSALIRLIVERYGNGCVE